MMSRRRTSDVECQLGPAAGVTVWHGARPSLKALRLYAEYYEQAPSESEPELQGRGLLHWQAA